MVAENRSGTGLEYSTSLLMCDMYMHGTTAKAPDEKKVPKKSSDRQKGKEGISPTFARCAAVGFLPSCFLWWMEQMETLCSIANLARTDCEFQHSTLAEQSKRGVIFGISDLGTQDIKQPFS